MTFFLIFLFFLKNVIFVVEPVKLELACNERFETNFLDETGHNTTVYLGAFEVPCLLGGVTFLAQVGECACVNDGKIVDDGAWEVCAFHCHVNDTMKVIFYRLYGLTEGPSLVRHQRSLHRARVTTRRKMIHKAVQITDTWESKTEAFFKFMGDHWFFVIILGMMGISKKKAFKLGFGVLAIAYWTTHFGASGCEDVLHYDTIRGLEEQQVWMTLTPSQCKQIGLEEAKKPVVFCLEQLQVDQGLTFLYLIPFKMRMSLESQAPCP